MDVLWEVKNADGDTWVVGIRENLGENRLTSVQKQRKHPVPHQIDLSKFVRRNWIDSFTNLLKLESGILTFPIPVKIGNLDIRAQRLWEKGFLFKYTADFRDFNQKPLKWEEFFVLSDLKIQDLIEVLEQY